MYDTYENHEEVPVVPLDSVVKAPSCVDFIKLDIEEMELAAIRGGTSLIERCRPTLYVENTFMKHSPSLIQAIAAFGYDMYWDVVPYYNPLNYFQNPINHFLPVAKNVRYQGVDH